MRLNAKGTVRSFRGRKLIYNKIITRKFRGGGGGGGVAGTPISASDMTVILVKNIFFFLNKHLIQI